MNSGRFKSVLGVSAALVAVAAASWTTGGRQASGQRPGLGAAAAPIAEARSNLPPVSAKGSISLVEAMLAPSDLPFQEPTTLEHVEAYLRKLLGAPVVIDRAALARKDLTSDSTVRIDRLKGVRLKTALRLLLEPVGLVARVLPDDHLVLLTDHDGSEDPIDRVLAELKTIHRELHDVQDSLDDVYDSVVEEEAKAGDDVKASTATRVRKKVATIRSNLRAPISKMKDFNTLVDPKTRTDFKN